MALIDQKVDAFASFSPEAMRFSLISGDFCLQSRVSAIHGGSRQMIATLMGE